MGSILEVEGGEVSERGLRPMFGVQTRSIALRSCRTGRSLRLERPHHRDRQDVYSLKWRDTTALEANAYYYIRVIQIDGEMGWSSPIWVDQV